MDLSRWGALRSKAAGTNVRAHVISITGDGVPNPSFPIHGIRAPRSVPVNGAPPKFQCCQVGFENYLPLSLLP